MTNTGCTYKLFKSALLLAALLVPAPQSALVAQTIDLSAPPPGTIVLEAEAAVSTNFAVEPVLLFGAGENRTLQLSATSLIGDSPFYADYALFADDAGEFELWYGGSLPGSADTLLPSYGSPFRLVLNDDEGRTIHWEDVATGGVYSAPYRWVRIGPVTLQAGLNRLRIEVTERRRYDATYFLYLDRLVLLPAGATPTADGATQADATPAASAAQTAPAAPSVDRLPAPEELVRAPEAIEDLLIALRDDPGDIVAYRHLAQLYTLVGDHINALRYLDRATVIAPADPVILQLIARNTIWRGDINGGLAAYWQLLGANPTDPVGFLEAGKIAAWSGFFGASEQFYLAGFNYFPDDLRLRINLGFTYLWSNRENAANEAFQEAESQAQTIADRLLVVEEYLLNEEPDRAERFLREAITAYPQEIRLRAALYDALLATQQDEAAQTARTAALAAVADDEALTAALDAVLQTYRIRDELIAEYEAAVAAEPRDVARRQSLAQTYFWVGRREEGIREYERLLALQTQEAVRRAWQDQSPLLWRGALAALLDGVIRTELAALTELQGTITTEIRALERADDESRAAVAATLAASARRAQAARETIAAITAYHESLDTEAPRTAAETLIAEIDEEMARISESTEWTMDLETVLSELAAGEGVLPGMPMTEHLLRWFILEAPLETNLLAGGGSIEEQGLAIWAWSAATAYGAAGRVIRGLPVDDIDAEAADLLVLAELYPEALLRLIGTGATDDVANDATADVAAAGGGATATPAPAPVEPGTARGLAEAALDNLTPLRQEAALLLRSLAEERSLYRRALAADTRRRIYRGQVETASLRNELGRQYLAADDLVAAITQLEAVGLVDPGNLDSLYTLSGAYQREGRWRQARDAYGDIYRRDPTFRNVAALHNEIARRNADQFTASAETIAEPNRTEFSSAISYLWRINSRSSLRFDLDGTGNRLKVDAGSEIQRLYMQQLRMIVSMPLQFYRGSLTLTPRAGADGTANQLYYASIDGAPINQAADASDYFQNYQFEPLGGLTASWNRDALFLSLSYLYGPYRPALDTPSQTAMVTRPDFRSQAIGFNATVNLQNRPSPIWSRLSTASIASVDLIAEDTSYQGSKYALQQDLNVALLQRANPFSRISLQSLVAWENYSGEDSVWYYQPVNVLQAGGGLRAQTYRPLATDMTWGLSGALYGGWYRTELNDGTDDVPVDGLKLEGTLVGEITRNDVAFQLAGTGSRVFYMGAEVGGATVQDYYNIGVTLSVVVRNPKILAP